jgi:hypothetical protein
MKKESSDMYRFHLRMWQATDPYSTDVEGAFPEPVQDEQAPEVRALDAIVNFFRRALPGTADVTVQRTNHPVG